MAIDRPYADRADLYAAHRWDVPEAAVDFVFECCALPGNCDVAELGSGTGAVISRLLERARTVYAVEPDEEMRRWSDDACGDHPAYRSTRGTAERIGLRDDSVDLVVAAQALQWFTPEAALSEMARILRPAGCLAVLWTLPEPDAVGAGSAALLARHARFPDKPKLFDHERLLPRYFAAGSIDRARFGSDLEEGWDRFLGGLASSASAPGRADPSFDAFREDARRLFDAFAVDGRLRMRLVTHVAVGPVRTA